MERTCGQAEIFVTLVEAFGEVLNEHGEILIAFFGCIEFGKELTKRIGEELIFVRLKFDQTFEYVETSNEGKNRRSDEAICFTDRDCNSFRLSTALSLRVLCMNLLISSHVSSSR